MRKHSNYTYAGKIIRVHGTAGLVVLESEDIIPGTGDLFLLEQSGGDLMPCRVEKASTVEKTGRPLFFLKFADIDNRSASEALKGLRVFENPGTEYTRPGGNEHINTAGGVLSGYTVTDAETGLEGYVLEVVENPAHLLLEIQLESSLILVPFVDAFILNTDHDKRHITARDLSMFTDL